MDKTLEQHREVLRAMLGRNRIFIVDKEEDAIAYLLAATDTKAEAVALINEKGALVPTLHGVFILKKGMELFTHPPIQPPAAQVDEAVERDAATFRYIKEHYLPRLIFKVPFRASDLPEQEITIFANDWQEMQLVLAAKRDAAGEMK